MSISLASFARLPQSGIFLFQRFTDRPLLGGAIFQSLLLSNGQDGDITPGPALQDRLVAISGQGGTEVDGEEPAGCCQEWEHQHNHPQPDIPS